MAQGHVARAGLQPAGAQPHMVAARRQQLSKALEVDLTRGTEGQRLHLLCVIGQLQGSRAGGGRIRYPKVPRATRHAAGPTKQRQWMVM